MGVLEIPCLKQEFELERPETIEVLEICENVLAVACAEAEILLIDRNTGQTLHELKGHQGGTNSLAFAAGPRLISAGEDGKAAIWDVKSGQQLESLDVEGLDADVRKDDVDQHHQGCRLILFWSSSGHTVSHIAVSTDGRHFACASGRRVHLVDILAPDVEASRKIYPPVAANVADVKLTQDGFVLAAYYGGISCWPMDVGIPGFELPYAGALLSADVSKLQDGSMWFVAGCQEGSVHIWKVSPGSLAGRLQIVELNCGGYEAKVHKCAFDATGQYLATIGGTRNTIWDFANEGPAGRIPFCTAGHTKSVNCQAWQPKPGGLLATGGQDGCVFVYSLQDYVEAVPLLCIPVASAEHAEEPVTQIIWGSDNQLYTGHSSGVVRHWTVPDIQPGQIDPIMASYAYLPREDGGNPQAQHDQQ